MACEKEVSLRRASHCMDSMQDFSQMLADEELVDVTLCTEDGSLTAHRMLLAASSAYFRTIFARLTASTSKSQYPVIVLKDIRFVDLKAVVDFIYRGEVIVPQSQLQSILKTAEGLKVRGLLSGLDTEYEPDDHRKKRRKRKRSRASKHSASDNDSRSGSDVTTDDDEDQKAHTATGTQDRHSNSTVGDVEPSRLLEQSMTITGDADASHRFHPGSQATNPNDAAGLISQIEGLSDDLQPPPQPQHPIPLISFDHHHHHNHHTPLPGTSGPVPSQQRQAAGGEVRFGVPAGLRANCLPLDMQHHSIHHLPLVSMSAASGGGSQQQGMSGSREDLIRRSRYPCPICSKQFSEKGNMKRHMTIHEQQRHRYVCDLCARCFSWKDNFHRHRRTHHV